jgi:hypothetical protein
METNSDGMTEYSVAKLWYRPAWKVPKPQSCNLLRRWIGNANHNAIAYAGYRAPFAYSALQKSPRRHVFALTDCKCQSYKLLEEISFQATR